MGIRSYLNSSVKAFRTRGIAQGASTACRDFLFGLYHNLPVSYGTPVFDREWELLVILDACRPDLMAEISSEYNFLPSDIPTIYSVASRSDTWMQRNFASTYRDEVARTAYVTGNPYSDAVCLERDFGALDEVWRYAWDEEVGSVAAEDITDRAISVGRDESTERVIVHYMQPHFPSFPQPIGSGIELDSFATEWDSVWQQLEAGQISRKTVWESYRENLRYVLDSVETLLENFDANHAVLSSDHTNAFGEWNLYGHPINKPAPVLRCVPWVPVDATDRREYSPQLERDVPTTSESVDSRLKDLGYLE